MFHIGWLPWKPGYVALALFFLIYTFTDRRRLLHAGLGWIFALFGVLLAATVVGSAVFMRQTGTAPGAETGRALIIYLTAPMAFAVAAADRRSSHTYVIVVLAAFLALNLLIEALRGSLPGLLSLYHLNETYALPEYAFRPGGIFQNPNVTALTGSLLLVLAVAGVRARFFQKRMAALLAMLLGAFAVAIFLGSRGEILAVALVAGLLAIRLGRRRALLFVPLAVAGVAALWLVTVAFDRQIIRVYGYSIQNYTWSRLYAIVGNSEFMIERYIAQADATATPSVMTPTPTLVAPVLTASPEETTPSATAVQAVATATPEVKAPTPTLAAAVLTATSEVITLSPTTVQAVATATPEVITPTPAVTTEVVTATRIPAIKKPVSPEPQLHSVARPLANWGAAKERWVRSPIVGTGFEESTDVRTPQYHNDWLTVLVTSGLIGLAAFAILFVMLFRLDPVLAVPFVLPGMVNAFVYAPQHFMILMLVAGLVAARRLGERPDGLTESSTGGDAVNNTPVQ